MIVRETACFSRSGQVWNTMLHSFLFLSFPADFLVFRAGAGSSYFSRERLQWRWEDGRCGVATEHGGVVDVNVE